jgi:hypothetical protein
MKPNPRIRGSRFLGAALVATTLACAAADYPAKVQSNNPVLYWRLNDKPSIPAADKAVNKGSLGALADGYYLGAASHPAPGALAGSSDTAVSLDATAGTVVSVPYSSELNPNGAFSAEAWVNPNALTTTAAPTCILASGQFAAPRSGWLIYQVDNGWSFRMYNQNGTATSANIVGGTAPEIGVWYHVVAVYDGTTAYLYVNGVQAASAAPTGYVPSAGGPLFVGGRSDSSFWWNGTADEVALYSKALTAAEVDAHYKNGVNASRATPYDQAVLASGPSAYYRLNEAAYTAPTTLPTAKNLGSAGAASDGSYNPGVNPLAAGPIPPTYKGFETDNNAGGFNGSVGFVGSTANLNDLAKFTVIGWLKRGLAHSGRGGYFGQNDLLEFGDADSGANIEAWINAYGTNIKIPFPFKDNEWGQIALVGDNESGAVLYTNGVPAFTLARTVDSFGTSAFNFNVGGGGIFNTAGDYFLGNIDEVAVFDKALTAQQVQEIYYAANIAPTIATQPAVPGRELFEGNAATLSVTAVGTPPLRYQWRKGGTDLPGKTSAELALTGLTVADSGAYDVVISNAHGSVTSASVTLTIRPADIFPPVLQYAAGNSTFNGVRVWFSEPLDQASAQTLANYQLSDGLTVTAAKLSAAPGSVGDNIVDLTTSTQTPGKTYTLTVSGVKDQSSPANTVVAASAVTFGSWTLGTGYLKFEHFDNLPGAADSDITSALADPRVVAGNPTTSGYISGRFDTRSIFPDDTHENFLSRITGWITPTESGDYYFFLRSDDAGRLYLSTTETLPNPATDTPICIEEDCCDAFAEPDAGDPATTSAPITLQAGKRYGVLALLKEAGGGDYLEVAWRKSTDTTAAGSLPYLPGKFFATYVDPNTDVQFTKQPVNLPAVLPTPVVEFASANFASGDGKFTVENTEKVPPGPWTHNAATGAWSADGGESACTGPYNSRLNSPAYVVPQTEEVTLTFSHRYSFEGDYWDGGVVRISVNGGDFTPVAPENFTANGYASGKIQGTGDINGQRGFNGDSAGYAGGGFITSSVILGSFKKNDTLVVQFLGAWDDCTTASVPGWVIKTVQLAYGKAPRAVTLEALATASKQGKPATLGYQWQRNDGSGFVDITDATTASYRFFPAAADLAAQFRVLALVPGKSVSSETVKVFEDTGAPEIKIARTETTTTITFTGRLQSATAVAGPYSDVAGASSPYAVSNPASAVFYRSAK